MTVGGGKVETVVLEAVPGEVRGKGVGKVVVIRWTSHFRYQSYVRRSPWGSLISSDTAYLMLMKWITEASGVRAVGGHGGKEDLPRAIEDEDATSRA